MRWFSPHCLERTGEQHRVWTEPENLLRIVQKEILRKKVADSNCLAPNTRFGFEGTFKDSLVPTPCHRQGQRPIKLTLGKKALPEDSSRGTGSLNKQLFWGFSAVTLSAAHRHQIGYNTVAKK